jgi:hypothetical protein
MWKALEAREADDTAFLTDPSITNKISTFRM